MKKPHFDFRIAPIRHSTDLLEFEKIFDSNYNEPDSSAIDAFIEKTKELNKLLGKDKEFNIEPTNLHNLVLLGNVSAVESFFRMLLRRLIIIDKPSRTKCESRQITYSAAISYDSDMLPESLMESCSFSSKGVIREAFRDFLGLKNTYPKEVTHILNQYGNVCHIRHCIVHRFGHLGSKNAIDLGLNDYAGYLNKPVKLEFDTLQKILLICSNTVKVINNYLFKEILVRTTEEGNRFWEWNYTADEKKFKEYFDIFYSKELSETEYENTCLEAYRQFKDAMEK